MENDIQYEASSVLMVTIDRPQWYKNPDFLDYINDPDNALMSFHISGRQANEWSDVLVWVDPSLNGEGDSSDIPEVYWDEIVQVAKLASSKHRLLREHIGVRIRNM